MVVLLILAILLAIAIPTFLGVKGGAQDRASQSNLTNALIVAKTVSANNNGSYPTAITTALNTAEPSLSFVTARQLLLRRTRSALQFRRQWHDRHD